MNEYLEKSGGRGYVERTKEEFDALLIERLHFEEFHDVDSVERIYTRTSADGRYTIFVFSSVVGGRTRDCGDDAIRVAIKDEQKNSFMRIMGESRRGKTGKRINRTQGAMKNLERRVKQYLRLGTMPYRCPLCQSIMAVRHGRNGKFLGCTNLINPDQNTWCKGTSPAPEWLD